MEYFLIALAVYWFLPLVMMIVPVQATWLLDRLPGMIADWIVMTLMPPAIFWDWLLTKFGL
jgi:hypothetical protein